MPRRKLAELTAKVSAQVAKAASHPVAEQVHAQAAALAKDVARHPLTGAARQYYTNTLYPWVDGWVAKATTTYSEVSGFTAVQQQRAVVRSSESALSAGRRAYADAETVVKSKRLSYEQAQEAATAKISEFNLNPDLPGHVKEYYFRSTMEELQKSATREAVDVAQAQLDVCTVELQQLTKGCGDAFSKLGEVESSWSHARSVIMSWATVLSLVGSFIGLMASFQVTKMRIETSLDRSREEVLNMVQETIELNRGKGEGDGSETDGGGDRATTASLHRLERIMTTIASKLDTGSSSSTKSSTKSNILQP